ncbi:hypothetical protein ASD82_11345 [Rhodanobacter sp. Root179]|nr:hypothetical protein ASD82_11345 [Rhodanobacter sp. Root179]
MLRGSTWSLRISVPKALRELRVQAGKEPGQKEIWRSLGTADQRTARLKAVEAKATLLREFDTEAARLTEFLRRPPRVVPNVAQIEQAVFAFKAQERADLTSGDLDLLRRLTYAVQTGRLKRSEMLGQNGVEPAS